MYEIRGSTLATHILKFMNFIIIIIIIIVNKKIVIKFTINYFKSINLYYFFKKGQDRASS